MEPPSSRPSSQGKWRRREGMGRSWGEGAGRLHHLLLRASRPAERNLGQALPRHQPMPKFTPRGDLKLAPAPCQGRGGRAHAKVSRGYWAQSGICRLAPRAHSSGTAGSGLGSSLAFCCRSVSRHLALEAAVTESKEMEAWGGKVS